MIQITSENNQLKVVTNGQVDYYEFSSIKSFSVLTRNEFRVNASPIKSFDILIEFLNESKNTPLRFPLSFIDNQVTWVNTLAGANIATSTLSSWKNISEVAVTPTSTVSAPTVAAVPVTAWNAATGFTTDAISFVGRDKNLPWSYQVIAHAIVGGTPTLTLKVSSDGVNYTNYKQASSLVPIGSADVNNLFTSDNMSAFEYIKLEYVPNGATGTFSLLVNK